MKYLILLVVLVAASAWWLYVRSSKRNNQRTAIQPGSELPEFAARSEDGEMLSSRQLTGKPSVILFVRGSWCPFCSEQVASLTEHYRTISESGGRLIIVTAKPLDTTRRVAELFNVDFEFWLDSDLEAADALGLTDPEEIPRRFQDQFGRNTLRPAVVVTDSDGVVRYLHVSSNPKDRPNPARFIEVFRSAA